MPNERPYQELANSMSFHEWVALCVAVRSDEVEPLKDLIERAERHWIRRRDSFGSGSFAKSSAEYALDLLRDLRRRIET